MEARQTGDLFLDALREPDSVDQSVISRMTTEFVYAAVLPYHQYIVFEHYTPDSGHVWCELVVHVVSPALFSTAWTTLQASYTKQNCASSTLSLILAPIATCGGRAVPLARALACSNIRLVLIYQTMCSRTKHSRPCIGPLWIWCVGQTSVHYHVVFMCSR